MTTTGTPVAPPPLPPACPSCGAPLDGGATCSSCDLPLSGPVAARLWEVDVELSRLDGVRTGLLAERRALLATLRGAVPGRPEQQAWTVTAPSVVPVAAPRQEWTPRRVQNLLLTLGGVLLAVAAAVFAAVTYDRLGVGGRAVVLLSLTAVAAIAASRLRARGLGATAETVAAVAFALAALDAWGLRKLGLGAGLDDVTWYAATAAVLAALAGGYAVAVPLRLPRLTAVALANSALLLAVVRLDGTALQASLLLVAIAALGLVLVAALIRRERTAAVRDVGVAAAVGAGVAGGLALLSAGTAVLSEGRIAALGLVACAALGAGAATLASRVARAALAAGAVLLVTASAVLAAGDRVGTEWLPLIAIATAATGLLAATALRPADRTGPVAGALTVSAGALLTALEPVGAAVVGPLAWTTDPWTLPSGRGARAALAPALGWEGSGAVVALLLAVAVVAIAAGLLLRRRTVALPAAGTLALLAAILTPLALDLPHPAALLVLLVLAACLVGAAEALQVRSLGRTAVGSAAAAGVVALLAAAWSLADQGTTLTVLPAVAVLLAVSSARPQLAQAAGLTAGLAAVVTGAELVAVGAARGLAPEQVGAVLLLLPALLATAAACLRVLGEQRRRGLEVAAAGLALVSVGLASADTGWLSWTLAGSGLLALATAVRADRRVVAPVGALLVTASSWVRLADAGVGAPEPYVLPVAALALLLGHLRFRRDPGVGSHAAYGAGLGLLLGPSLLASLLDDGLARPLLLGAAALAVLLLGARTRLQAPLVIGAGVLAVVALDLLAPYASAVPRWTALAAAGTLLVLLGATFEQRRRELLALRERVAALR